MLILMCQEFTAAVLPEYCLGCSALQVLHTEGLLQVFTACPLPFQGCSVDKPSMLRDLLSRSAGGDVTEVDVRCCSAGAEDAWGRPPCDCWQAPGPNIQERECGARPEGLLQPRQVCIASHTPR